MSWPRPIRIVGVGSANGDDAVGWEVVVTLRKQLGKATEIETRVVDGGQRILDVLDGRGSLVLVDAVEPNDKPGTLLQLEWPNAAVESLRAGSTHDFPPSEALKIAETLGMLPQKVVLFGIEASTVAPGDSLSANVRSAADQVVDRIMHMLGLEVEDA